jgi:hypothetical protein
VTFDEDQEADLHKLMNTAVEQAYRMAKAGVPLEDAKRTIIDALVSVTEAHE